MITDDAHVIEGAGSALEAAKRWPDRFELRAGSGGGLFIEGRRYPEHRGPGAGCPPQHGVSRAEGIDPSTVDGMLADADREGIDQMVLFPSMALAAPGFEGPAFAAEFCGFYNAFIADWCAQSPGRLFGAAVVPIEDVDRSIELLREARGLGLVCALVPPALRARNLDHPDLDPFYAAAVELDLPLGTSRSTRCWR